MIKNRNRTEKMPAPAPRSGEGCRESISARNHILSEKSGLFPACGVIHGGSLAYQGIMQESGCDCVKLEGGAKMAPRIRAIVDAGIPVMAHIGLTPQSISALGGFKVQGKDSSVADQLLADALAVEEAGAFGICLECMPVGVAKKITETVKIPTCGIGAGLYCDGQELNLYDMTGLFGDFKPKFVKHYAELRQPMVDALNAFYDDTCAGTFPTPEYSYNAKVEGYPVD